MVKGFKQFIKDKITQRKKLLQAIGKHELIFSSDENAVILVKDIQTLHALKRFLYSGDLRVWWGDNMDFGTKNTLTFLDGIEVGENQFMDEDLITETIMAVLRKPPVTMKTVNRLEQEWNRLNNSPSTDRKDIDKFVKYANLPDTVTIYSILEPSMEILHG